MEPASDAPPATSCTDLACHRKTLDEIKREAACDAEEEGAKYSLFDLLCIGLGSTVGSGVFILTGDVLPIAGPSAVVCWLLAGLACLLSALSYIELSTRIPTSGSCYAYAHHALGEVFAVVGALCLTMEYGISGAGVARGWSRVVATLVGGSEHMFLWYPGVNHETASADLYFDYTAGLVMLASVAVCSSGVSIGRLIINAFTVAKVGLVIFLIVAGLSAWNVNVFESSEVFFPHGFGGTMRGVSALFFGFIGFDEVCCLAGKAERPTHTMPRALAGTLFGAAFLSMLAQLALVGMVPAATAMQWPDAFALHGWHVARWLVNVGEVVLLPLVVVLSFLPQPELLGAMGKDGLLPEVFARKDKAGTHVWGSNLCGAAMVLVACAVPFNVLWDMISLGVLLGFNLTNTSLIMVRYGSGGELRAPGVARLVAGFWVTGAIGAYTFYQGFLTLFLEGKPWQPLVLAVGAASLLASALLLVLIGRHNQISTQDQDSDSLFLAPAVPFVPGLAMVVNFMLMATLPWRDHFYMLCCILASLAIYRLNGRQSVARESPRKDEEKADDQELA